MPDNTMNCADAGLQMRAYLAGEPCPALAAHLAGCDACRLACLETALRERPEVAVPPRFAALVMAQLPPEEVERSWAPGAVPVLFALLGVMLWWRGDLVDVGQALRRWEVLTALAALETVSVLAWAWRVATRHE